MGSGGLDSCESLIWQGTGHGDKMKDDAETKDKEEGADGDRESSDPVLFYPASGRHEVSSPRIYTSSVSQPEPDRQFKWPGNLEALLKPGSPLLTCPSGASQHQGSHSGARTCSISILIW